MSTKPTVVQFAAGVNSPDWTVKTLAERWIAERGWSIGPTDVTRKRCVMFGDYRIAKWKNLTATERAQAHAVLEGDSRRGPLTLTITPDNPTNQEQDPR